MRLLFKQRLFSWFDSYDIYNEAEERVLTWMPKFELYTANGLWGTLCREFFLFHPRYRLDGNSWRMKGDFFEWDYTVEDGLGQPVATVSRELFRLTDTYVLEVGRPENALGVLMLALAIDAEKCSRT